MGGSALELDGLHDRGRWFWDHLDVERRADALVDDVVAVDLATDDPPALAARWSHVLGVDVDARSATVALGERLLRFVPQGDRPGIVAADLRAVDPAHVGQEHATGNVRFRLVGRDAPARIVSR
jgi:hypothetical protein